MAAIGLLLETRAIGTAYNLTVEGIHTYYVIAGDRAVLVHNDNCGPGHGGHQFPGPILPRKSQFYDGLNLDELSDTTGRTGYLQPNGNGRHVLSHEGGVGVDKDTGLPTDLYTVIRDEPGRVVTMYPGTSPMG